MMKRKWLVVLLFSLVSLGQAHPFAYALSHGDSVQVGCSCKQSGKKCVHGCSLRRKSKSPSKIEISNRSTYLAPEQTASSKPEWVSPQCSRQQQAKILSFQSDPFLIPQETHDLPLVDTEWGTRSFPVSLPWTLACESPPPKPNPPDAS